MTNFRFSPMISARWLRVTSPDQTVVSAIVVSFGLGNAVGLELGGQLGLARGELLAERIHVEPGLAGLGEQAFHPLFLFLDMVLDLLAAAP